MRTTNRPLMNRNPTPAGTSAAPAKRARNLARIWREEMGQVVADLRVAADMTQSQLADAVGLENKQSISLIENGHRGIPPERVAEFAKTNLRYTNPWDYAALFGADAALEAELAEAAERINTHKGPKRPS